MCNIAYIFIY